MKKDTVAEQIKGLTKMKSAALREQFHKVTGKDAPNNDRAFLIKTITSALQKGAIAKDEAAIAKLEGAAKEAPTPAPAQQPKAAAKKASTSKKTETKASKAAATQPAPRAIDPRLPPVGTVLRKLDRHGAVRCECIVEDGGSVRYKGAVYSSLSAAASAASKDLGGGGGAVNGYSWWGIIKVRSQRDPMIALDRAWERYRGNVESLVKTGITDDNRSKVASAIKKHATAIETLRDKVA